MPSADQPSEQPQSEKSNQLNTDSEKLASRDLTAENNAAKERDEIAIAKVRDSLGLEKSENNINLSQHLQEYLELKDSDVEKIGFLQAENLPQTYQTQREFLDDERLNDITIAVVPDELWKKGSSVSESDAEKKLILIKQSYFEKGEDTGEIAWMAHELAHCQKFFDSETPDAYEKDMKRPAPGFEDIPTEYDYPNNPVELHAFTKQFEFLKEQGKSKEYVAKKMAEHYLKKDLPFFDRLLDNIYSK